MSIQIPEDKGAKKREGYWNVSIVLGSIDSFVPYWSKSTRTQ